jgi:hypothetical protein
MENDLQYVRYCMDNEGLDYCFRNYSEFEEVQDEEFQKLRKAYVDAAEALDTYVKDHSEGEEDY